MDHSKVFMFWMSSRDIEANTEQVLEGAMMVTAVLALTVGHPGPMLGCIWRANGFSLRNRKRPATLAEEKNEYRAESPA